MTMQELVKCGIVPSLYVRAYHTKPSLAGGVGSSLTASEGVSRNKRERKSIDGFPHYM